MAAFNSVRFECTALSNTNIVGKLKQDDHGFFEVVLGALNVYNSAGEFYDADGVRKLFAESGLLMRRLMKGRLRGENGHPKRDPGMSDRQYLERMFHIVEPRICCHYGSIFLDDNRVKDDAGKPIRAIIGRMRPDGELGYVIENALKNNESNICFSIRAFTDDKMFGMINHRFLKTIITWDHVNDPGIAFAEKWKSPVLESFQVQRGDIEAVIAGAKKAPMGVSTESAIISGESLLQSMGWVNCPKDCGGVRPGYMEW